MKKVLFVFFVAAMAIATSCRNQAAETPVEAAPAPEAAPAEAPAADTTAAPAEAAPAQQ